MTTEVAMIELERKGRFFWQSRFCKPGLNSWSFDAATAFDFRLRFHVPPSSPLLLTSVVVGSEEMVKDPLRGTPHSEYLVWDLLKFPMVKPGEQLRIEVSNPTESLAYMNLILAFQRNAQRTIVTSRFLTVLECAAEARTSPESVRYWIKTNKLRSYKPGKIRLIAREDFEAFLIGSRSSSEDE